MGSKMIILQRCTCLMLNVFLVLGIKETYALSLEKKLLHELLTAYGSSAGSIFARPVFHANTTVHVKLQLALIEMNFDEKKKTLNLSVWTRYTWVDEFLTWDPRDYGGIDKVKIDPQYIWMPDIQLQNTGNVEKSSRDTHAVIYYDGYIIYYTLVHYSVSCALNLTNFPFDHQECQLLMGSWIYPSNEVEIHIDEDGLDLSNWGKDFKDASSWNITGTTGSREYIPPNATISYTVIIFTLNLERKIVFSTYILTLPCVFLACLTIAVFWLPPQRPDRTALAMNTFGSFMLLLLILVESAPPTTSTVPLLGVYYCLNIVAVVVAIILSTIVVNLSKGSARPLPKCLEKIIYSKFGKVLMLHDAPTEIDRNNLLRYKSLMKQLNQQQASLAANNHEYQPNHNSQLLVPLVDIYDLDLPDAFNNTTTSSDVDETHITKSAAPFTATGHTELAKGCSKDCKTIPQMKHFAEEIKLLKLNIRKIVAHAQNINQERNTCNKNDEIEKSLAIIFKRDWELFGVLLDRIFCILYIILAILGLVFCFPRYESY